MTTYIRVKIRIFGEEQDAEVQDTLTVDGLIDAILAEFDDLDRRWAASYGIFMQGTDRPLPRQQVMARLKLVPGDVLEFKYARPGARRPMGAAGRFALLDRGSGLVFPLLWQPAIIGRPDANPDHNELLVYNAEDNPEGQRVSRSHAQISEAGGRLFVESLAAHNPVFLNQDRQAVVGRQPLQPGDRIRLGSSSITLELVALPQAAPPVSGA